MRLLGLVCLLLQCCTLDAKRLEVLHLSMHSGCFKEIAHLASALDFELTNWNVLSLPKEKFDGETTGCDRYNIDHKKADEIWQRNCEFFNTFDVIVTSDTAPLSRIFLQNGWEKPLIIWVCNRFDYCDEGEKKCHFPDREYYTLFSKACSLPNVRIISYTQFEHIYAENQRSLVSWSETIRPIGAIDQWKENASEIPDQIDKKNTFFIPPYHNDTLLLRQLNKRNIPSYRGRYGGPEDLKDFKGIIHIPYAWSNLALFENWANGVIYFIPSELFLVQIAKRNNFFWSPPFSVEWLKYSEWYNPAHRDLFVYFNSWKDLKYKIKSTDYKTMRQRIQNYSSQHAKATLKKWRELFNSFDLNL